MAISDDENIGLRRLPPQELEAEQMVLGACLLEPARVIPGLRVRPEDFYRTAHGQLLSAMLRMHERGTDIDLITLDAEMRNTKEFAAVGGAGYLAQIISLCPSAAGVKSHEKLVISAAERLAVIRVCSDAMAKAYDLKDADGIVSECIGRLNDIRRSGGEEAVSHKDIMLRVWDWLEWRHDPEHRGKIAGIPTGIADLDRRLDGLHPNYIVVAGESGMGKTALVEGIVNTAARYFLQTWGAQPEDSRPPAPAGVGVLSLEMGPLMLALRALARSSDVAISRFRAGDCRDYDWEHAARAMGREVELPIWYRFESFSDREIERGIDDFVQRLGCKLIVLDYAQLSYQEHKPSTREQEVAAISRLIKRKVKKYNIPIIVISSLSKIKGRMDLRPTRADLRDSNSLEYDSDIILFVYREEMHKPCPCPKDGDCLCGRRGKGEIIVAKGRMEELGVIPVQWKGRVTSFRDAGGGENI